MVDLWDIQTTAYIWTAFLLTTVYVAVLLGIVGTKPEYIQTLETYIKVYVSLFLIWRFNPITATGKFTELDRKIVFAAALVVLSTSALNTVIQYYMIPIRATVHKVMTG
jgi:hypothetical protein